MKPTMTETDAMGEALAYALEGATTFGKAECQRAMTRISLLVKQGKLTDADADSARARLGNHSAVRQHGEKHGYIAVEKDALTLAVIAAMERLGKEVDEAVS